MKFTFPSSKKPNEIAQNDWDNWQWQLRHSLKNQSDFASFTKLTAEETQAFEASKEVFNIRSTPYYASLIEPQNVHDPLRRIFFPNSMELFDPSEGTELDPLGERKSTNNPVPRIVHRYSDRVLFLVTDVCSVYCRYCTRKHFTGADQAFVKPSEYDQALTYIKKHRGLREVILSGGDPLTISDSNLEKVLTDLRSIDHVEIIRIGTRMPVVAPMRITANLLRILKAAKPVFVMTHFNHPKEITLESARAVESLVDNGTPVMNQMVLLNGVNNHPAIVQALSRRLLFLRAKPYYMFQCDPAQGTDYLRTSVDESLEIQRELWGHLSGLAMPTLSLDIPNGGGKMTYAPNFETQADPQQRSYKGWDGVVATYKNPSQVMRQLPFDFEAYLSEWDQLKSSKTF